VVFDGWIEPDRSRRLGCEGRIVGDDLDGDGQQAALLAVGVHFDHEGNKPIMLVVHGRPRESLPKGGIVGNGGIDDVEGD
jgi:hypothetical protein